MTRDFYQVNLLSDDDLTEIFKAPSSGVYYAPARTGKGWFHHAITKASAVVFLRGDNESAILIAVGPQAATLLERHKYLGFLVRTERETKGNGD